MTTPFDPLPSNNDAQTYVTVLDTVLSVIQNVFSTAGVVLPNRQYVHFGEVAVDCEQLTVQFVQAYLGVPGGNPAELHRCESPQSMHITVELWRCEPIGNNGIPSAAVLDAASEIALVDAYLLLASAGQVDAHMWRTGVIADVSSKPPSGGFIGSMLTLTVPV